MYTLHEAIMEHADFLYKCENSDNSRLFEFLETHYDIKNLANKIMAQTKAPLKLSAWKKSVNIASA